jgi:hypothetical protein
MTAASENRRSSWTLTDWEHRLSREPGQPLERFTEADVEGLEAPVRRYLAHAIAPATPLSQCARLSMRGSIKLGRWLPFRARQVLRPHDGFVWAARVAGVIAGSDQYLDGTGGMDWKLGGLLSVAHEEGPDVSRSAADEVAPKLSGSQPRCCPAAGSAGRARTTPTSPRSTSWTAPPSTFTTA